MSLAGLPPEIIAGHIVPYLGSAAHPASLVPYLRPHAHLSAKEYRDLLFNEGDLDMIRRLNLGYTPKNIRDALAKGHTKILMWAVEEGYSPGKLDLTAAAEKGYTRIVEYLGRLVPLDRDVAKAAIRGGCLDIFRYYLRGGGEYDPIYYFVAGIHGRLGMIVLLESQGYPPDVSATNGSAAGGHLGSVIYLVENGFPWDVGVARWATSYGHLDVLRYYASIGGVITDEISELAAERGYLHILQWLHDNGHLYFKSAFRGHIRGGHPGIRNWLQRLRDWSS